MPRLAGLLSWSNENRTFGALVSIAYSERSPILGSFNTTRWQKGDPSNVNAAGNPYGRGQNFGGCIPCTTTAQRDAVLNAFYPRIPRYTLGNTQEDRLGMTGALQWRPSDRTEAVLDVLWSRFNSELESPNIEAWSFSRANVNSVVVRDYAIDADKNILSYGVFDNMLVRAENGFTRNESNFYQASLNVRHDFSDRLHGNLKVGANRSEARTPLNVAYAFEAAGVNGYTFDFREDDRRPRINYGFDVTSGQRFTLVNATRSNAGGNFDNKVGAGSLAYDWSDSLTFKIGGEYRTYGFETFGLTRTKTSPTGADRLTGVDSIGRVVSIGDGVSAGTSKRRRDEKQQREVSGGESDGIPESVCPVFRDQSGDTEKRSSREILAGDGRRIPPRADGSGRDEKVGGGTSQPNSVDTDRHCRHSRRHDAEHRQHRDWLSSHSAALSRPRCR